MKILFKILFWLLALGALLAIVGFFLPKKVVVERTAFVKAPPATVYGILNDLKTYNSWMPWNKMDPNWKMEYGPQTVGKGAFYKWESENRNVGKGKLTISESVPNEKVTTTLEFDEWSPGEGGWKMNGKDDGTEVTWFMNSDMGNNPFSRWMGLFFDKMMGPDFEKGLKDLKQVAESAPAAAAAPAYTKDPTVKMEEKTIKPFVVLYTTENAASTEEIGSKLGAAYGEIGAFIKKNGLKAVDMPSASYASAEPPFNFEAWMAVDKKPAGAEGRIRIKEVPGGKVVLAHIFGPYELGYKAYAQVDAYLKEKGLTKNGQSFEIYVNDPTTVKDPYEIQTDYYVPVK